MGGDRYRYLIFRLWAWAGQGRASVELGWGCSCAAGSSSSFRGVGCVWDHRCTSWLQKSPKFILTLAFWLSMPRDLGKQATLNLSPWHPQSIAASWFPVCGCKWLGLSDFSLRWLNLLVGLAFVWTDWTCFAWLNFSACDLSSHFCVQAVARELCTF